VPWPDPRFTDNGDETVTDKLTGLMWAKDANAYARLKWSDAIDYANDLNLGNAGCGTNYTVWRLPNIKELLILIDYGYYNFVLPRGHPFSKVQDGYYWSSTTEETNLLKDHAFKVSLVEGRVSATGKSVRNVNWVWPVRGETIGSPAPVPKTGQQD
jgi:hypothetical protein